jgi:hypothetical protein
MGLSLLLREIPEWSNESLNILWGGSHSMTRTAILNRRVRDELRKGALWRKIPGRIRYRSTSIQNLASQHQINSAQYVFFRNPSVDNSGRVIDPSIQIGQVNSIFQRLNTFEDKISNNRLNSQASVF